MPVEVEREQGEVSVEVDIENKQDVVVAPVMMTKKEVGNGINHNGNGNDKDDGSYVFVTEKDAVGDDDSVDANVVKDLKEGEDIVKKEVKSDGDDVLGVSQDSQILEMSDEIPKADSLEKSVEKENNGHLETGDDGKLESREEVEKPLQDSEVGPMDLPKNNEEEKKPQESDSQIGVEGHQGDTIEAQEKPDLHEDVSKDVDHDEELVKDQVDSSSELVSAKVSPAAADTSDGGMGLEQPTLTDPASTITGSESVDDHTGSESVSVENGHPLLEPELEKTADVPVVSEAEKVNGSSGDVLPDSGTVEVAVSEVSSDVPAESQSVTAVSSSGKDGVVENGISKSESEEIQKTDFVENSKPQAEIGAGDVTVSDESMKIHPETLYEKQLIASEVAEVLDVPTSEESSDAVIVSKENVSEAASTEGLSSTNQQESEHDKLPSHALTEAVPSGNDTSVKLINDDTRSQGFSEDHEVDRSQKIQDDCSAQSEEVTDVNGKNVAVEKLQENNSQGNLDISGDVCLNSAEEGKDSPTNDVSGNVSHESAETLSTNTNGPSSLLDSKTAVSKLDESSAEGVAVETGVVATNSEAAHSVKEGTERPVASPTILDGEISREVNSGLEVEVTKTTPVVVCEGIPLAEVSEVEESDIKERFVTNSDEEVKEENSGEKNNEASGATAPVASETETCEQNLEPKVVASIDTIHIGAKEDCVDSKPAENKGGDDVDSTDDKVASTTEKHLASASPVEGSLPDASEGQIVAAEIEKRPFYFLPRVPRYDDEKLTEQLKHAEAQVDKKTQSRDALRADIQKIRATCKDYDITYKEALAEERSARKAMHTKRQEIDALQSVISRVKSAASIDDIDSRVHNMEHIIQHETISLSEEKGYIREIKQLKQLREQISSSMGTKDEIKQALDDKEKTEERVKVLRKELDALRNELSKVEAVTKAAKKKCDDEWEVQSKLQEQFRAADAVRQEAFVHLQNLKKQQRQKNKFFFKYRDDSRAASEMALKKDRAALQKLCANEVESFMNKWNNDEEFRSYYVRCNTRSTVRRFGTLDGRSLGPDEEPLRIAYGTRTDTLKTSSDRTEKHETAPPVSAQQEKVTKYEGTKPENNVKAVAKPTEQKSQTTKSKKTGKPEQPPAIVKELGSGDEEIEKSETKEEEEPPKLSKEEEELIKKEEEKRKQKEAAEMKEQHRLEEIAKAKEAMERKKKREEKAKARAVLKAQKEAEEREKEREKKLRKKERRKGGIASEEAAETSETVIETPREIETPKKQTAEESQQTKKSHKQFLKHNKSKSIPLPLRNRASKRKLRQWMWIGLIVLVVIALFLLGNANLSFSPVDLWFMLRSGTLFHTLP